MGAIQVLRIETRKELTTALIRHADGRSRPSTARSSGGGVELLGGDLEAARRVLHQARPTGRGRRPKEAIEFVIGGPPAYHEPGAWTAETERAWAAASVAWAKGILGERSAIAVAALHRDETAPHVHVLAVPVSSDGRLGWCRVRDEAAALLPRRGRKYRAFQDDYQASVGVAYGLARGKVGSQATHAQIDRQQAAEGAAEKAEQEAERLTAEAEEAQRQAKEAERQAEEAEKLARKAEVRTERAKRHRAHGSPWTLKGRALRRAVTDAEEATKKAEESVRVWRRAAQAAGEKAAADRKAREDADELAKASAEAAARDRGALLTSAAESYSDGYRAGVKAGVKKVCAAIRAVFEQLSLVEALQGIEPLRELVERGEQTGEVRQQPARSGRGAGRVR